jgi:glycogen debranching enzyme
MTLEIDLRTTPFSRRASYFGVSRLATPPLEGLYLRTVHGGARTKEIFRLALDDTDAPDEVVERATPQKLTLDSQSGGVDICIDASDRLLVRGVGRSFRMEALVPSPYDLALDLGGGRWQYICYGSDINLMITVREGHILLDHQWSGVKSDPLTFHAQPDPQSKRFRFTVERFGSAHRPVVDDTDFDVAVSTTEEDFHRWLMNSPAVPPHLEDTRELAAYVNWASVVAPRGHITRPVMFMSKNWMTNVWAWDHCFNAMALLGDVRTAADQFLCIFDYQDADGGIPDCFNDTTISWNFTKPAVHGWALAWLMQRAEFGADFYESAYFALKKWTEWWFATRDYGGEGLPAYNHGNDSGWDNGTAFRRSVPIESPDQIAFLVIQLETLSTLAEMIGLQAESGEWRRRSDSLLSLLLREFWVGERFVARDAITRAVIECESLLMFVPLVLGERLPADVFDRLVDGLISGQLITEFGLATESVSSESYESDGYWRGPIWAPPTLLIVDGLMRGGRADLAGDIARRFCELAARSGMAENYDAVTGEGLRDRAYTWTASTFLVLASEYAR